MAKLSSDGKYVTVEKGDTLSQIALDYLGSASKYKELAAITKNRIVDPDRIYVGQIIYLSQEGPSESIVMTAQQVAVRQFGLQSDTDNELFVTWEWYLPSKTQHYEVWWEYKTVVGVWFTSNKSTTEYKYSTLTIPERARQVRVRVKPIPKKEKVDKKETDAFSAIWTDSKANVYDVVHKPDVPTGLNVTIDDLTVTAKVDNVQDGVTLIEFEVVKDNSTVYKTNQARVSTKSASYSTAVVAGGEYKVRCRAYDDGVYSDWSDYSSSLTTRPSNPGSITKCEARSESSIYIEWGSVSGATSYTIEYSTKRTDFDTNDKVQSITGVTSTQREITGLESGNEYFFRLKAVNDKGESQWSAITSVKIGTGPSAPTTWSSTTTAIAGEDATVSLYWVHNTEDNSSQTYAEVELTIDGVVDINGVSTDVSVEIGTISNTTVNTANKKITYRIDNTTDEKTKNKTHSLTIKTRKYSDGASIRWRVRTAGITNVQGEWSIQRTVSIYSMPSLDMSVKDSNGSILRTLTAFPFNVSLSVGGINTDLQRPIGYYISIMAAESYETVDAVGNRKLISTGDTVYSQHYNHSPSSTAPLSVSFSPGNVDLENGIDYTIKCIVSMSSGITVEAIHEFSVSFAEVSYSPNAEISIDTENYSAYIRPYCSMYSMRYFAVSYTLGKYTKTTEELDFAWGERVAGNPTTTTGEAVYYGADAYGNDVYFCSVEDSTAITNVIFSIYRREFDGSFVEIASGLDGADNVFVTDPHPALNYARYRIVAKDKGTGSISYYDMPNHPVGGKSIVIQWDEKWVNFEAFTGEDSLSEPAWSGSMLKLPYNVDISDSHNADVALVEYIGRKHPVSYYGTQLGETATWNADISKTDEETLYALRRLAKYSGDVYVREPSGSGYWANVTVSFSQKHCDPVVPVTLEVKRVEGGM